MEFLETNELRLEILCRALYIGADCYMGNICTTAFQMFFPLVNPGHPLKALPGWKRGCSVTPSLSSYPHSKGNFRGCWAARRWVHSTFVNRPELNHSGAQNHHPRQSCLQRCLEICLSSITTITSPSPPPKISTGHSLCLIISSTQEKLVEIHKTNFPLDHGKQDCGWFSGQDQLEKQSETLDSIPSDVSLENIKTKGGKSRGAQG